MLFSGLALGDSWGEVTSYDSGACALEPDFYREPDDVTRGLTFCSGTAEWGFGFADVASNCGSQDGPLDACTEEQRFRSETVTEELACHKFQDVDVPPTVPVDPSWRPAESTLYTPRSAVDIGNELLDFFRCSAVIVAAVTKVSRKKFSMKVEVMCFEGPACVLKVRMYQLALGLVVEFQRRSGDGIAFNDVFRRASQHLNASTALSTESIAERWEQLPLPIQSGGFSGTEDSLSPFLEMAECSDEPRLQAEAASGLAAAAKGDAELAGRMCTPGRCAVILKLLQSRNFSVAQPAARLLSRLSQLWKGGPCFFAEMGLLDAVFEKVLAHEVAWKSREKLVRQ